MPRSSRNEVLLSVLGIGRATSMRGEGISLRDALSRVNYSVVRPQLDVGEIVAELRANPEIVEEWILYCEDKREEMIQPVTEVRDAIENVLIGEIARETQERWLQQIREDGYVRYFL